MPAATPKAKQSAAIKAQIAPGYALHIDPDYLLLTYGEGIVTGDPGPGPICPRYALCIGVKGDATFWVLLTTKSKERFNQGPVPVAAKHGSWVDNIAQSSYFNSLNVWVLTKDMVVEAHFQAGNPVRQAFKHSGVHVDQVIPWPDIPVVYPDPTTFKPIDRLAKPATTPTPAPIPEPPMTQAALDEPVATGLSARANYVEHAVKLLNNPRLTDQEVVRLVDHLQSSAIDILLGA